MPLLSYTSQGLYCAQADFFIDPHRAVNRAVITHGHSDHARRGMQTYLCTPETATIIRHRLGRNIQIQSLKYGESVTIHGVSLAFYPAGHILGSAMVRLEYLGEVWVVSGDYKWQDDGLSGTFQPIRCHHFISEATFGMPYFQWRPQGEVFDQIHQWWSRNQACGRCSVLHAYSLGKAQRLLFHLDKEVGPVFVDKKVHDHVLAYEAHGVNFGQYYLWDPSRHSGIKNALLISSERNQGWQEEFASAYASGWMQTRRMKSHRGAQTGFVLSDHADWGEIQRAISASEANHVYLTHGQTGPLIQHLRDRSIHAMDMEKALMV